MVDGCWPGAGRFARRAPWGEPHRDHVLSPAGRRPSPAAREERPSENRARLNHAPHPFSTDPHSTVQDKILLGTLAGVIVLALGGTAAAYTAFSHTVTVSVDGHESTMRTFGDNVGAVLASKGIKPGAHDSVVPSLDTPVDDGSRIAVRLGRPLALSIDGKKQTRWTTATTVAGALEPARHAHRQRRPVGQPRRRHRPVRHGAAGDHAEARHRQGGRRQGRAAQRPGRDGGPAAPAGRTPAWTATTSCDPRGAPT